MAGASQHRCQGCVAWGLNSSQAIDPNSWRNWVPLETLRPKREAFVMSWWALTKEAAASWVKHKDAQRGAALAYYSIFSLGPLMVIAIAIAGLVFGQEAVRGEVGLQLKGLLGDAGAQAVDAMLAGASKPQQGIVATVLGIGLLLIAAVGVVVQLKDALNTVWEVEARKKGGIWQFVLTYCQIASNSDPHFASNSDPSESRIWLNPRRAYESPAAWRRAFRCASGDGRGRCLCAHVD